MSTSAANWVYRPPSRRTCPRCTCGWGLRERPAGVSWPHLSLWICGYCEHVWFERREEEMPHA